MNKNLLKSTLCALALAATFAWAGSQSWSVTGYYNSGTNPGGTSETRYFNTIATTQVNTAVYGGIPAGGVAVVVDTTNGALVSYTSISILEGAAPAGSAFAVSDFGIAPAGASLYMHQNARSNGPGGYATAFISVSW